MVSLTSWLDPALKYFADQAGISTEEYVSTTGGEAIGVALENVAEFFTKGWLKIATQFATGLLAGSYAIWGKDVPRRLRLELIALANHELFRIAKLRPEDVVQTKLSLDELASAIKARDVRAAVMSGLRSPSELQAVAATLGLPTRPAAQPVSAQVIQTTPPAPATKPAEESMVF